jgi:hypothetical protein
VVQDPRQGLAYFFRLYRRLAQRRGSRGQYPGVAVLC